MEAPAHAKSKDVRRVDPVNHVVAPRLARSVGRRAVNNNTSDKGPLWEPSRQFRDAMQEGGPREDRLRIETSSQASLS
jgi:hypothetical protein